MQIGWLPAVIEAYKRREELATVLDSGISAIFGNKTVIAVTGMAGVGKTVLFDHLTGKASKVGYTTPRQSTSADKETIKAGGKRLKLVVLPGQDSNPRHVAAEDLFEKGKGVDGVVHVVSNGFASVRTTSAREGLIKCTTIAAYRKRMLRDELTDLEDTCRLIERSHKKYRKPTWIVVAVDKVDLYQSTIVDVQSYYSPRADNKFGRIIRGLIKRVGSNGIRWDDTVPVCSRLEEFRWGTESVTTTLGDPERNAYLVQFMDVLKGYSA